MDSLSNLAPTVSAAALLLLGFAIIALGARLAYRAFWGRSGRRR
jgi:hypothetical protein